MSFPDEYSAFKAYADMYPTACTLLVDTYDTLKSGVPNAIRVFDEMKANNQITGALNKLFALSEAYPELKANENFMSLQRDLKDIEDKISYARQFYNDSVMTYNNKVQMFPTNIIANIFNFKESKFFEIENEKDKETPKVSF